MDTPPPGILDDPDGPIVGGPAQLPILSLNPEQLPAYETSRRPPEWAVRLGVLFLGCALFLPNLGSFGLWDPWETHYGEVTRYMIETGDWVHPWWGYKGEQLGGEKGPGEHFYSKPILLFWMEAATIRAIGLTELAIRLPVAFIAILAMFCVYYAFSKLLGRPRGFMAALVLATCPQFYMLARQSQTDMPFVGNLTIAMSFFALALFGPRQKTSDRRMWMVLTLTLLALAAMIFPQLGIVIADVNHEVPPNPDGTPGGLWAMWQHTGWMQAVTFLALMGAVLLSIMAPIAKHLRDNGRLTDGYKDQLRRRCYLWMFYAFCGIAMMGKGLLGFMLPGAVIFVYLAITNEWTLLVQPVGSGDQRTVRGRAELIRGIAIFCCVALPWYVALLAGPEGKAFWNRFFIHDHFNRLGTGVHAIDDGTFEHFLKWLGIGIWPWIAFMPLALVPLARHRLKDKTPEARLRLFLFLWFFVAFCLFTMSSTKFHHYIFPALPPLAILIAWGLHDVLSDRTLLSRAGIAFGLLLFVVLAWDIRQNPQHLRNLFTYKYDREYPADNERPIDRDEKIQFHPGETTGWEVDETWADGEFYKHTPEVLHDVLNTKIFRYQTWITLMGVLGACAMFLMIFSGNGSSAWGLPRSLGMATLASLAVAMTMWALSFYMPSLGPHWSQKYLFDRYYDTCVPANNPPQIEDAFTPLIAGNDTLEAFFEPRGKRVCREEVISWLLTWRGETYYSNNAIRPIQKEHTQFQPYLEEINKGARYYVHIERSRAKAFKGRADSHLKKVAKLKAFKGIKEYAVTLEHNENHWFVLLKADPICKKGYTQDVVGRCIERKKE